MAKSFKLIIFIIVLSIIMPSVSATYDENIQISENDGKLSVCGRLFGSANMNVAVQIIDNATNNIEYYNQIKTDNNGRYSLIGFELKESGEYKIRVMPSNYSKAAEKTFSYNKDEFTNPSQEQILTDIQVNITSAAHPYIHGKEQDLQRIKELIGIDYYITEVYTQIKESADRLLSTNVIALNGTVNQTAREIPNRIITLVTAAYVEEDQSYITRAIMELDNLLSVQTWYVNDFLDTSATVMSIGVCYDWLYDYLSQQQRDMAVWTIKTYALDIITSYYNDPSPENVAAIRAQCNNTVIAFGRGAFNHNIYNNSFLALAALAIADVDPEYSAYIISNALYNVEAFLEKSEPDGGFTECSGYWRMSAEPLAKMYSGLESVFGTMYGYEYSIGFKKTAHWPIYIQGTNGVLVWGDTYQDTFMEDEILFFYAKKSNDYNLLSEVVKREITGVYTLFWYEEGMLDNLPASQFEKDKLFRNVDAVIMRDTWEGNQEIFAGMQVGKANRGHGDASSGMFGLDALGERFVTVPGRIDYSLPGYWHYNQTGGRWNYYARRTEGNNALVINPSLDPGQLVDVVPTIEGYESGEGSAYAWTDLTEVYSREVSSYKRGIKLFDNRTRFVVQDEATMNQPSDVHWSFNTPAEIDVLAGGTSAMLTIGDKRVLVRASCNVNFTFSTSAATPLPTSPQIENQPEHSEYRKLVINLSNVSVLNLMVEFVPILVDEEIPAGISQYIPVDSWSVEQPQSVKPVLDSITVNGDLIKNFNPYNRYYQINAEGLTYTHPVIQTTQNSNYNVNITMPLSLHDTVKIEVDDNNGNVTYYVIRIWQTSTMPTLADTWTGGSSAECSTPHGGEDTVKMMAQHGFEIGPNRYNTRAGYYKFEIPNYIEHGKILESATLKLYQKADTDTVSAGWRFYKEQNNWNESTFVYNDATVNYLTIIDGTSPLAHLIQERITYSSGEDFTLIELDVTDLILQYDIVHDNIISFVMIPYNTTSGRNILTASKEHPNGELHPALVLKFLPQSAIASKVKLTNNLHLGYDEAREIEDYTEGETIKAMTRIKNYSENEIEAMLIIAFYNKNNMMNVFLQPSDSIAIGDSIELESIVTIPQETPSDFNIRGFVWQSFDNIIPLG